MLKEKCEGLRVAIKSAVYFLVFFDSYIYNVDFMFFRIYMYIYILYL